MLNGPNFRPTRDEEACLNGYGTLSHPYHTMDSCGNLVFVNCPPRDDARIGDAGVMHKFFLERWQTQRYVAHERSLLARVHYTCSRIEREDIALVVEVLGLIEELHFERNTRLARSGFGTASDKQTQPDSWQ
eukprot:scaffold15089_cov168-Amphora_coffeaeformis.AAC.4